MTADQNRFKTRLQAGELQIGIWSSLVSPISAELIAGSSGIDWALIDMEHASNELADVIAQLRCYEPSPVSAIVRPPSNDPVILKRLLDAGVANLLIPFVQDEQEARRAVAACRYPPVGERGLTMSGRATGYGRRLDELYGASKRICVIVQVETSEALENLEAIATVDGVDAVFVGPSDLSASMGYLGTPGEEEVQAAIRNAAARLAAVEKPCGILASIDTLERYADWGFTFMSAASDLILLRQGIDQVASLVSELDRTKNQN